MWNCALSVFFYIFVFLGKYVELAKFGLHLNYVCTLKSFFSFVIDALLLRTRCQSVASVILHPLVEVEGLDLKSLGMRVDLRRWTNLIIRPRREIAIWCTWTEKTLPTEVAELCKFWWIFHQGGKTTLHRSIERWNMTCASFYWYEKIEFACCVDVLYNILYVISRRFKT